MCQTLISDATWFIIYNVYFILIFTSFCSWNRFCRIWTWTSWTKEGLASKELISWSKTALVSWRYLSVLVQALKYKANVTLSQWQLKNRLWSPHVLFLASWSPNMEGSMENQRLPSWSGKFRLWISRTWPKRFTCWIKTRKRSFRTPTRSVNQCVREVEVLRIFDIDSFLTRVLSLNSW